MFEFPSWLNSSSNLEYPTPMAGAPQTAPFTIMPFDIILPIQAITFITVWIFIVATILSDHLGKIRRRRDPSGLTGPHFQIGVRARIKI